MDAKNVNTGQREIIEACEQIRSIATENACGWSEDELFLLGKTIKALISIKVRVGLSIEETARYFGVSRRTIQRRVKEGSLPQPKTLGHKEKTFFTDELDEYSRRRRKD